MNSQIAFQAIDRLITKKGPLPAAVMENLQQARMASLPGFPVDVSVAYMIAAMCEMIIALDGQQRDDANGVDLLTGA